MEEEPRRPGPGPGRGPAQQRRFHRAGEPSHQLRELAPPVAHGRAQDGHRAVRRGECGRGTSTERTQTHCGTGGVGDWFKDVHSEQKCWKRAQIKGGSQIGVKEASGGEALLWPGLWWSWKLLSKPVKAGIYSAALGVDSSHMLVPSLLWKPIALIVPVFTLACEQTAQFVSSPLQRALFLKADIN